MPKLDLDGIPAELAFATRLAVDAMANDDSAVFRLAVTYLGEDKYLNAFVAWAVMVDHYADTIVLADAGAPLGIRLAALMVRAAHDGLEPVWAVVDALEGEEVAQAALGLARFLVAIEHA